MSPLPVLHRLIRFDRLQTRLIILSLSVFGGAALLAGVALALLQPAIIALRGHHGAWVGFGLFTAIGLAALVLGVVRLAHALTRPIIELNDAVSRIKHGDYVEASAPFDDELGHLVGSFNTMIRDLRDREDRLTHIALHDPETGLPNRLALERLTASQDGLWVILLGIDRFEVVRGAIGYDATARLLTAVGRRLALMSGASISRVSAAGFGLAVVADDEAQALQIATDLCAAANTPVHVSGAPVDVALTAGVARGSAPGSALSSPIDRAAIAVGQARRLHRPAAAFDATAYGDPAGNLSLISELMAALDNGEFSLAYQPKYDFRAERITGVEALARWTHPRRGVVTPDVFVGMAEETGHIRPLTEWVIRQAIADQVVMAAAGYEVVVSVNVSGRLLCDDAFADFALQQIADTDARLCFEITETAVMHDPEQALKVIARLSDAGVRISLDDYGSGLSSLSYLKRIPADELKIDKDFITGLDQSARDALLVKSTIDLAHGLGLRITAEGVETPTALALLRGMGCDMAQGFLIGKPKPLPALLERLARDEGDAPALPGATVAA